MGGSAKKNASGGGGKKRAATKPAVTSSLTSHHAPTAVISELRNANAVLGTELHRSHLVKEKEKDAYREELTRLQTNLGVEKERAQSAQTSLAAESASYQALLRGAEQQLSAVRQDHARERDAHAREAERRAELQESLAAARDRLAHVTSEAANLRAAQKYAAEESARRDSEARRDRADASLAKEKLKEEEGKTRELTAKIASFEGVLRSLGEKNHALQETAATATEGHQRQMVRAVIGRRRRRQRPHQCADAFEKSVLFFFLVFYSFCPHERSAQLEDL